MFRKICGERRGDNALPPGGPPRASERPRVGDKGLLGDVPRPNTRTRHLPGPKPGASTTHRSKLRTARGRGGPLRHFLRGQPVYSALSTDAGHVARAACLSAPLSAERRPSGIKHVMVGGTPSNGVTATPRWREPSNAPRLPPSRRRVGSCHTRGDALEPTPAPSHSASTCGSSAGLAPPPAGGAPPTAGAGMGVDAGREAAGRGAAPVRRTTASE